ncbi:hypothetical protein JCM19241_4481 [Vibrio ishigakensis]|uniref:tRNA-uridine aminocarboxypropyltransferase n=1 Tax=Vibrio ishigakensis TaxID=1481914 RepID=A0A0B8QL41_9VIBR|nr:hypothetical protein JCM19241_4481 [Vibrio ishigakensis]
MSRYCEHCGRALKACLCGFVTEVTSSVEVIILQHPSEVNQAKGTAKLIELSMPNSKVFVGEDFSEHQQLNQLLAAPDYLNLLLFPSDTSNDIAKPEQADFENVRLILLDGTWKKAFKMFQLSNNLHHLPQVHLPADLAGRYTIRKAPRDNALSTVEAAYHALTILDKEPKGLIEAFDKMIEFQLKQVPEHLREQHFGERNR